MSKICKECGGVDVHHRIDCSRSKVKARADAREAARRASLPPPPPPPDHRGKIVTYVWPSNGATVVGIISDNEDDDGKIGFAILTANIRVNLDDVEEIH